MLRRIIRSLRNDRGEASAVSIVLGTLLFLASSAGVVSVIGPAIATTGSTRQTAIIESYLEGRVQTFQSTPWMALAAAASSTASTTSQGVTFSLTSSVTVSANPTTYTLRVAAPTATTSGTPAVCSGALTSNAPGCLMLSSVRIATIQEQALSSGMTGLAAGPDTVNATQHALDILTVTPANVIDNRPVRVQAKWLSGTNGGNSVQYGFFCGANSTPQTTSSATIITDSSGTSIIMELTPSSLRPVGGCTTATLGLFYSTSTSVAVTDTTLTGFWPIIPVTGGTP